MTDIQITAEGLQQQIVDSILNSTIGATIQKQLDREIENLRQKSWNVDEAVKKIVADTIKDEVARQLLLPENQAILQEAVAKRLTSDLFDDLARTLKVDRW